MSARDLVGRPLVPFFDAQDNVNETLSVDAHAHEQLDVDARVWDKELGYFVYPTESPALHETHSMPIPIKKAAAPAPAQDGSSGSFGKMLLTPDMLSRSAPSASGSGMEQLHNTMGMTHPVDHHAPPVIEDDTIAATSRSASAKRASRQKSRSSTPNRNARNKQRNANANANANPQQPSQPQQQTDGGSSGGEDRTASDSSDKSKSKKNTNDPSSAKKSRNKQPQTPQKSKDDLSANGKWAWSAFQSSPDPKSLPLPSFAVGGGGSPSVGALPPPLDPPQIEERLDPPPPPMYAGRPPEGMAIAPGPPLPPPHPSSLEHSMTQDLRRMLNIGT